MDKKRKTIDETSPPKLTEDDIQCDGKLHTTTSEVEDSKSGLPASIEDSPDIPATKSTSKSTFDRRFDEFGLWILTLTFSFVLSGLIIPWLFLKGIGDISYAFFVLFLGGISCGASVLTIFLWWLLGRKKVYGMLRIVIALWCPVLLSLSQLFYGLPGSLLRVSNNDHYTSDLVFNILIFLVLPSLIGSSCALVGLTFRKKLQDQGLENIASAKPNLD